MTIDDLRRLITAPLPFGEAHDVTRRVFTEPVQFAGADIANVDFSGATFRAQVSFAGAQFTGLSWFRGCRFDADADFSDTTFANDARFDAAEFVGDARFSGATIEAVAAFDRATFRRTARFDRLVATGNVSLAEAEFGRDCDLRGAVCLGGLWLDRTRFTDMPALSGCDVHGRTWLRGATVGGLARERERIGAALTAYGYRWT